MERGSSSGYTIKYFRELGWPERDARLFARNWKRQTPQSMEEVRQGVLWERKNREIIAASRMEVQTIERR